jgi:hypothetical protein
MGRFFPAPAGAGTGTFSQLGLLKWADITSRGRWDCRSAFTDQESSDEGGFMSTNRPNKSKGKGGAAGVSGVIG